MVLINTVYLAHLQMLHHLGNLPQRLVQSNKAVYDHVDCPPVGYPEITDELFCHRYYLRNFCNTERFPDWPIVDHVPFLQVHPLMVLQNLAEQ